MNKKLYKSLLFLVILISFNVHAGKFYWVGGSGAWDYLDKTNWSLTSGGTGLAGVPGPNDTAYFDSNSFIGTFGAAIVGIVGGGSNPVQIHTIDFNGVTDNPTLAMGSNDIIEIFGSLNLDSAMSVNLNGNMLFRSTNTGNTINLYDHILNLSAITFDGTGGEWTLKDSLLSNAAISVFAGNIVTNGYNIRCNTFTETDMSSARGVHFTKKSKLFVTGSWNFTSTTGTLNFIMDSGTKIIMKNPGALTTFDGGGLTYANVAFMGIGGTANGSNYFDTLSIFPQAVLTIPTDTQYFKTIFSYANPGQFASINGGSTPIVLYDLNGGLNCLNYTNLYNIKAQGFTGSNFSSYAGTNSGIVTGVSVAVPPSFTYSPYKASICTDGNDAAVALQGSGGIGTYTFLWNPGSYIGDTLKSAIAGTTYTINMRDVCHAVYTSTVIANGSVDNVLSPVLTNDTVLCLGQIVNLTVNTATGSVAYTWSPTTGLSSTTTNNPIANPLSTTVYTVTMSKGTCSKKLSVKLTVENPKAVLTPDSMFVCNGSEIILDGSGSSGIINYPSWTIETADFSDSLKPKFIDYAVGGKTYFLNLYGQQCSSVDSIYVEVADSITKIHGKVTYDNGTGVVTKGFAKLFMDTSLVTFKGKFEMIDSVLIMANGSYAFDSTKIKGGNYVVRVYPDATMYPLLSPMYYLEPVFTNDTCTFYWDSAHVINVNCGSEYIKNIDIDQLPDLSTSGGKGIVNGRILEGVGYVALGKGKNNFTTLAAGDPISGVGIGLGKKPNPASNMVASTTTNSSGFYQFKSIPAGDYVIFADIPGLPMDSTYNIKITGIDTLPDLDYYVNDSIIYIKASPNSVRNISPSVGNGIIKAYPNPYSGAIVIDFKLTENSSVTLEVFNLLGEKISVLENGVLKEGLHKYTFSSKNEGLSSGIYIVKLTVNNSVYTQRIVELK